MSKPSPEWNMVVEGAATKINFDKIGDVFIGTLVGRIEIKPENMDPFDVWQFHAAGGEGLEEGELVNINTSYGLRELANIAPGSLVRLQYQKDVPTAKGNPMKSFIIQTKAA